MEYTRCKGCMLRFRPFWLRDGKCNGCRNPALIVEAKPRYMVRKLAKGGWIVVDTVENRQASGVCKTYKEAVQLLDRGQYAIR